MMAYMRTIMAYAALAVISFLLHLIWERLHIVLYTGYEALEGILPVYVFATFGDVLYSLFAVLAIAAIRRNLLWMNGAFLIDYAILTSLGLAIAIFVETKAQWLGRWEYTEAMPTIHGLGLSPLLQMTVLLPLSVYLSVVVARIISRYNTKS